jgi:hypothetical protein
MEFFCMNAWSRLRMNRPAVHRAANTKSVEFSLIQDARPNNSWDISGVRLADQVFPSSKRHPPWDGSVWWESDEVFQDGPHPSFEQHRSICGPVLLYCNVSWLKAPTKIPIKPFVLEESERKYHCHSRNHYGLDAFPWTFCNVHKPD